MAETPTSGKSSPPRPAGVAPRPFSRPGSASSQESSPRSDATRRVGLPPLASPLLRARRESDRPVEPPVAAEATAWETPQLVVTETASALDTSTLAEARERLQSFEVAEQQVAAEQGILEGERLSAAEEIARTFEAEPVVPIESLLADPVAEVSESEAFVEESAPEVEAPALFDLREADAELAAFTAESESRERAANLLEAVARRLRAGEISVACEAGISEAAVMAQVLATLLRS